MKAYAGFVTPGVLPDSGKREEFKTGAVRDIIIGKGRYDLLSSIAIHRLAQHSENGGIKYEDRNWEKGIPLKRFLDSALRHLFQLLDGGESEDHAAAVMWNVQCFIHTQEKIRRGELSKELAEGLSWNPIPLVKWEIQLKENK